MIHHLNGLSLTERLRESLQDSGGDFQFAAVESNLVEYADNCASWHWHEFVELGYLTEGRVECSAPSGSFFLEQGEGYFINANVLHTHRMAGMAATFRVIHFIPGLLGGARSIYGKYIAPVERCGKLEAVQLRLGVDGEAGILDDIRRVFALAETEPVGYELNIMERLFHIWLGIYGIAAPMLADASDAGDSHAERVKAMLAFIHTRYADPLSVADIAASVNISEREAYRSFRQVLDTTPTLYLLHHRVNSAARMLIETRLTVTEISLACGFSSPSYMCKAFHDLNGVSPRDFRRAAGGARRQ